MDLFHDRILLKATEYLAPANILDTLAVQSRPGPWNTAILTRRKLFSRQPALHCVLCPTS